MRRTIGFFVAVGLFCGGGVVCWRLRRRRRSPTAAGDGANITDRFSHTVEEARWEDEGGAVLPQWENTPDPEVLDALVAQASGGKVVAA